MSKVDKKRHAELSERVDDLTIKLEEAEQDILALRVKLKETAAVADKVLRALAKLLRMLGLV